MFLMCPFLQPVNDHASEGLWRKYGLIIIMPVLVSVVIMGLYAPNLGKMSKKKKKKNQCYMSPSHVLPAIINIKIANNKSRLIIRAGH